MSATSTNTAACCPACSGPATLSQEEDGMFACCGPCKSPWVPLAEWNGSKLVVVPPTETPRRLFEQSKARLALVAKEGSPVWGEFRREVEEIAPAAKSLTVTDADDTAKMREAREKRLKLRDIRLDMVKTHRDEKAESLAKGQALDAAKRELLAVIEPLEQHLLEQEEFAKRQKAAEVEKCQREREEILRGFVDNPETLPLAAMGEEEFLAMRDFYEARKVAKLDAERTAAAEEAERVRKEREDRAAEKAEVERLRKEAAENQQDLRAERAAAEELARELREQRRKAAAIQQQKDDAAHRQQEEAEAAAKAPDREKLIVLATELEDMNWPEMATDGGLEVQREIATRLNDLAAWVRTKAENL